MYYKDFLKRKRRVLFSMNQPDDYKIQPFFSIWLHPKKTASYVIEHKNWTYVILYVILGGMASTMIGLSGQELYPSFSIWLLLLGCILAGPFIGAVSVIISSCVIWLVGKLFKGKGSFEDIFKVISLSSIPNITLAPFMLVWMANAPQSFFNMNDEALTNGAAIISIVLTLAVFIVTIWTFVIQVGSVATAHRFSNWRSFFTLVLPGIVIGLILIGIVLLLVITFGFIVN